MHRSHTFQYFLFYKYFKRDSCEYVISGKRPGHGRTGPERPRYLPFWAASLTGTANNSAGKAIPVCTPLSATVVTPP